MPAERRLQATGNAETTGDGRTRWTLAPTPPPAVPEMLSAGYKGDVDGVSEAVHYGLLGDGGRRVASIGRDEREREQQLQLAREIHDVVASGFAVVSLQASVAAHL